MVWVLAAVVVAAATAVGAGRARRDDPGAEPPAVGMAPARTGGDEAAPPGWRRGASGPLRHRDFAVVVWTGSEVLVWGGDPDGDSGAAYDPAADRWRAIADAPIPALCQTATTWTGREVLVAGRSCSAGSGPVAAAYEPAADRWRLFPLPADPLLGGDPAASAWTGAEWVVVSPGGAAALDPVAGRWRHLPAAPRRFDSATAAWTGRELLVFGRQRHEKGPASAGPVYSHWLAALDPAAGRWRSLPDPPLELAATAVWDGRELVAWDQNLHAAALDPAGTGEWRTLPDLPVDFTDCIPQGALIGALVFAEACGQGAVFRPATGAWERIAHPRSLSEAPVWTGQDALFWVGSFAGSADGVWLYRPPPYVSRQPPVETARVPAAASTGRSSLSVSA